MRPEGSDQTSEDERLLAAAREQASAAAAFRRFVELTATQQSLMDTKREEFFALLGPFLRNPRYRAHVEMIAEVALIPRSRVHHALAVRVGAPMNELLGGRLFERTLSPFRRKLKEREQELLAEITLGEVVVDILPVRVAETPSEWPDKQAHILEARVDVAPPEDLVPASVAVRIFFDEASAARMLDAFPKTETAQEGAIVREGEFVESSSSELTAGLDAKIGGVGPSVGAKFG